MVTNQSQTALATSARVPLQKWSVSHYEITKRLRFMLGQPVDGLLAGSCTEQRRLDRKTEGPVFIAALSALDAEQQHIKARIGAGIGRMPEGVGP
jgi:hypothetical protein